MQAHTHSNPIKATLISPSIVLIQHKDPVQGSMANGSMKGCVINGLIEVASEGVDDRDDLMNEWRHTFRNLLSRKGEDLKKR